jgi:Tol biopolymer transport system component
MGSDGGPPPPPEMMPKPDKAPPAVWSTFSPDGKLLLVAGGGKLRLVDADTGAPIGVDQGAVRLPAGAQATHPDWSPLGDRVAVTLGTKGGDKQTEGGSIALLAYADHAFGEPTILIPSASDKDNNFFPSFSPDGRLIAFVNATGGSQEATSARLRLVDVASGSVRELVRLNERVGPDDGVVNLGNTMPTWAPSTEPGQFWLAFSSLRAYAELRPQDPKQEQLWIAGIDPALDDPGFAAFWAPFQSLAQGNHRAVWTPAPPDAACGCVERCANGTDDDCDGRLDEDDCVTGCADREICGDGIDNDCDCVVDDCSQEICDDGIDNDGDGKSDKMDVACP